MKIGKDKIQHFSVCFIISVTAGFDGALLATGLSIGKEYGDSKAPGNHWDWMDIIADAAGILSGCIIHYLAIRVWN